MADERGVALTEFALVLPVLMLVLAGILFFGRIFFYWLDANRLAAETARFAVVDQNPFDPQTLQHRVYCEAPTGMRDRLKVSIGFKGPDPATGSVGDPVVVVVEKTDSLIPLFELGDDITIRASATMRMERFTNGIEPTAFSPDNNLDTGAAPAPDCPE